MRTGVRISPALWLVLLAAWPATASAQLEDLPPAARLQLNVYPNRTTASLLLSSVPFDPEAAQRAASPLPSVRPPGGAWFFHPGHGK
jgi:hypothetical protein